MKTSSSFTKCDWVPRLKGKFLPKECCLTCKMPFLSSTASQEVTPGVEQQLYHPPLLPSRAAQEGSWSLGPSQSVSGCWWLFSVWERADLFLFLILEQGVRAISHPLPEPKPWTWNTHGSTALKNIHLEGEEGCFWNSNPFLFLTSLFKKGFWFMLNSTLPALPQSHMISRSHSLVQLLQAENPSPAPAAFLLSCFANICHTSLIALTTTLHAHFLKPLPKSSAGELQAGRYRNTELPACLEFYSPFHSEFPPVAPCPQFSGPVFALRHVEYPYGTNILSGKP